MRDYSHDLRDTQTTDDLADLLRDYCADHALPWLSADELLYEVQLMRADEEDRQIAARLHRHEAWLLDFIERWNVVQGEEDFQAACAARGES